MHDLSSPSARGAAAEAAVACALVRAGYDIYLPAFSAHSRVDLIYERNGRALRVQCKTARVVRHALYFRVCSNTANRPRTYAGEVEEFGVYSPDMGLAYMVPNVDLPSRGCTLRLGPALNGQLAGIRWASDYELGPP